ncbi:MAG: hypothetical protein OEL87_02325, partial [Nanoarchaeota archaeon]|nr:hypothetical protein [Nanoarchaeota archaeon]
MTLRWKTIIFSVTALLVMFISLYIFQGYRETNKNLIFIVSLLNEIRISAHEIGEEIRQENPDLSSIKKRIATMPEVSRRFQDALGVETKGAHYIDVEISFVRLGRVLDKMLPGLILEEPLLR